MEEIMGAMESDPEVAQQLDRTTYFSSKTVQTWHHQVRVCPAVCVS